MKTCTKIFLRILFIILVVISFVISAVVFSNIFEFFLAPKNWLFYEHHPLCNNLLGVLFGVFAVFSVAFGAHLIKIKLRIETKSDDFITLWNRLGRGRIAFVVIWFVSLYICMTNVTFVTEDRIIVCSPLNPAGTEYEYSDVEQIETGFGKKKHSIYDYEHEGSFYYKITLDGKTKIFHMPSVNSYIERYYGYGNTYFELEEFDQKLTELDIPKKSDDAGYENCDFDQIYVDRFLRIVNGE